MGDPPSSFGALHLISTQLEEASIISRGPRGGVGLSEEKKGKECQLSPHFILYLVSQ